MRGSSRSVLTWALLPTLVCGLPAAESSAQSSSPQVEILAIQPLTFGSLIPGVPERIGIGDGARRAEFIITGSGSVELRFVLPPALVSPSRPTIPLRFEHRDAALFSNASEAPILIDPMEPFRVNLQPGVPLRLVVGGTAVPARNLGAGSYTANVLVVVANRGS